MTGGSPCLTARTLYPGSPRLVNQLCLDDPKRIEQEFFKDMVVKNSFWISFDIFSLI